MSAFQLPKDGAIYTDSIFNRCHDLISYDVWAGIEPHRLDLWIRNFDTAEGRYFAARLLDSLIYRSDKQTVSLMKQMFHRALPDLSRSQGLSINLQSAYTDLQQTSFDPGLRLVPVIPPGESPTKSGPLIGRMLRRQLNFKDSWIVPPDQVSSHLSKIKTFVFVDDFLGTGLQFSQFLSQTGLDNLLSKGSFIYAPLAAHIEGIKHLNRTHSKLFVETVEALGDEHAFFHDVARNFPDEVNSTETARDFYYNLMHQKDIEISGPNRRGFGHFELAYAFEHAVPDNSLPILWWGHSSKWQPLFKR